MAISRRNLLKKFLPGTNRKPRGTGPAERAGIEATSRRGFLKSAGRAAAAIGMSRFLPRRARGQAPGFEIEKRVAGANWKHMETALGEARAGAERRAVESLIIGMPAADLRSGQVTSAFILHHARSAIEARQKFPWGKKVSDEVFHRYVLPYRAADWQRLEQRDALAKLTAGIVGNAPNELEACFRVQKWLGDEFKYERLPEWRGNFPTLDAMLKARKGKCGETSTLFVMMARSVGIPARYVELPWWSHLYDPAKGIGPDNHAWAEVWTDGAGVVPKSSLRGSISGGGFQPVNTFGTWAPATKEGVLPWADGAARWGYIPALYTYEFGMSKSGFGEMRKVSVLRNYRDTDSFTISARCKTPPYGAAISVLIGHGAEKAIGELYKAKSAQATVELGDFGGNLLYLVHKLGADGKPTGEPVLVRQLKGNVAVDLP